MRQRYVIGNGDASATLPEHVFCDVLVKALNSAPPFASHIEISGIKFARKRARELERILLRKRTLARRNGIDYIRHTGMLG